MVKFNGREIKAGDQLSPCCYSRRLSLSISYHSVHTTIPLIKKIAFQDLQGFSAINLTTEGQVHPDGLQFIRLLAESL